MRFAAIRCKTLQLSQQISDQQYEQLDKSSMFQGERFKKKLPIITVGIPNQFGVYYTHQILAKLISLHKYGEGELSIVSLLWVLHI